jgi:uncharacterized paraquat-inducible protein A
MSEETKQIGIRIPLSMYQEMRDIAYQKKLTITDVAIEAFESYLQTNTPGLCSKCHFQNRTDDDYCSKCGNALTEQAQETKEVLLTLLAQNPDVLNELMKRFGEKELEK